MNVVIVEDEPLAVDRLKILISQFDNTIKIDACLQSIDETVQWLQTKAHPDLLFMDIQLSDGLSFEIFKYLKIQKPIVFTTAYDNYAIDAFKHFSIDYILKPVTAETLATAIHKYKKMPQAFYPDHNIWGNEFKTYYSKQYKDRFLGKVGLRTFFIQTDTVCYFYSDNKTIYLVDAKGNKFVINYTIEKLEPLLDPHCFFRINRQMIVHSKMIDVIKPYLNNRLILHFKNIKQEEEIIVSRERVCSFKKWAEG
ncbi:MAG: LytTR family DNA-binding domain-containing protein [Ferruginibacter sp.]